MMFNLIAETPSAGAGIAALVGIIFLLILLAVAVLTIAGMWKTFIKANKPGWAAIVPIYNAIIIIELAKKPVWWIILLIIPVVNIVVGIIVLNNLAKSFGCGVGTVLGLIFLPFIFWPILGFGSAQYEGTPTPEPTA